MFSPRSWPRHDDAPTPPPLVAERVRRIGAAGFAYIPNRFLHDGFFAALGPDQLRLYFVLVLAADRQGMSFYHYEKLCSLLKMSLERYLRARDELLRKDLLAFDGTCFQVLELPTRVPGTPRPLPNSDQLELHDPATVRRLVRLSLRGARDQCPHGDLGSQAGRRDAGEKR